MEALEQEVCVSGSTWGRMARPALTRHVVAFGERLGISEGMRVLEWPLEPGDAVAFDFKVLHGARGNMSTRRRRAFSLRFVGDDARYVERPGRTSPPFPGHDMQPGQRLREDWFPVVVGQR